MSTSGAIAPALESAIWFSMWSRASVAVSSLHTRAQRMPSTLLAAICSPLPEPPMTTPRSSPPAARAFATPSAARRQKTG